MVFVFVILLFFLNSAVADDVVSRIIWGTPAPIEEYPFFARIQQRGQFLCGAAIISDRWLLTAAHCINWDNVYVVGGDRNDNSYIVVADIVVNHPQYIQYNYYLDNDIALVRLASSLQFSDKVQAIRLPTSYEVKGPLLGLGRGQNEYGSLSTSLMKVDIMKVDTRYCRVTLGDDRNIICVTRSPAPFANICFGDSGGPLVSYADSNATLVGIASFITNENCLESVFSAFTNVPHYMSWIRTVMQLYGR